MINKFILSGRLVGKPKLKFTNTGTAICSFSLNAAKTYVNANETKNKNLIDIISWRQTAELVSQTFSDGDLVLVVGSIYKRSYRNRLQQQVEIIEFIADEVDFCGKCSENESISKAELPDMIEDTTF